MSCESLKSGCGGLIVKVCGGVVFVFAVVGLFESLLRYFYFWMLVIPRGFFTFCLFCKNL